MLPIISNNQIWTSLYSDLCYSNHTYRKFVWTSFASNKSIASPHCLVISIWNLAPFDGPLWAYEIWGPPPMFQLEPNQILIKTTLLVLHMCLAFLRPVSCVLHSFVIFLRLWTSIAPNLCPCLKILIHEQYPLSMINKTIWNHISVLLTLLYLVSSPTCIYLASLLDSSNLSIIFLIEPPR